MRLSGAALTFALALLGGIALSAPARAQGIYAPPPPASYPSISYYYAPAPGYIYTYRNYYPRNAFYYPPSSMPTSYYSPSYAAPTYSSGASFYGPSAPPQNIISYYTPGYILPAPPVTYYYWSPYPEVIYRPYYR